MIESVKNIVVVGGSYVGKGTAQRLAEDLPLTHRVLLIEPHTHFHHIFAFPRFAVVPGHEQKAFIPYTTVFDPRCETPSRHKIVTARVLSVQYRFLTLDREWSGSTKIDFEYLVVATGNILKQPTGMDSDFKAPSLAYLRNHQDQVKLAKRVLVVGGGAAGVQMATDLKQYYPEKQITLVHSRQHLMPRFHCGLHELIRKRFDELGIDLITGVRIVVPESGFSTACSEQVVRFQDGTSFSTDFVILTTGQISNNSLLKSLDRSHRGSILSADNGQVNVRPTLQFKHPKYDHCFAVGDIADTGAHKAARPGAVQAAVVAANIKALIDGHSPAEYYLPTPAGIHLTLGFEYSVIFRNPNEAEGRTEPVVTEKHDGKVDMNVASMWERFGISVKNSGDYHL